MHLYSIFFFIHDSMASIIVSKVTGAPIPEDAVSNPHHILKGDVIAKFMNPHPSFADPLKTPFNALGKILWCVRLCLYLHP